MTLQNSSRLFLLLALFLAGCTTINLTPDGKEASKTPATAATKPTAEAPKKKSPFKPTKEVLKDTRAQDGFFKTHLHRDQKMFMEIRPDQLGKEFGMLMHFSEGAGVFNLHDGLYISDMRLMRFERIGDQIYLFHVNPRFTADEGSALSYSLSSNTGHSVVHKFKISSVDEKTNAIVIDVTPFFVSNYANLSEQIKFYYGRKPVAYDKDKSYLNKVMSFPKNLEIDVMLSYRSSNRPITSSAGISDYRSVPVGVRYSMVALPETPMEMRYADDRVGHFGGAVRDFSKLTDKSSYVRHIDRWRLEPSDMEAFNKGELVEPKKPIVYYIDHSVPAEYRKYVKAGVEAWNDAFEVAGFKNAVVAKNAPKDSTWSAEDARYSTILWTAAHSMGYAIGPSQTDPRTGEILNADILISSTFVTGWNNEYQQLIGEEGILTRYQKAQEAMQHLPQDVQNRMCLFEMGKTHQLGLMELALLDRGLMSNVGAMPEEFLGDAIRDLIMHEVGHTLGLRHNFKGSSAIPYEKLNDESFTQKHGLTLSVMDYASTNIAVDPKDQGDFVNMTVGTYDKWAIEYAYKPIVKKGSDGELRMANADEEKQQLSKIASKGVDPMHAYNTDEDTHLGPMALDPSSNTWDLSSDPIMYAKDRSKLVAKIQPRAEERLIASGDGYQRLRNAINGLMFEQYRALVPVTKYVGGNYFYRDHKGDDSDRLPFTPVSAKKQREAVALLIDKAFSPGSFSVDGEVLNKLTPLRYSDWSVSNSSVIDFPIHEQTLSLQRFLLSNLTDNGRLARIINNAVRMPAGQEAYTLGEFMGTLTDAMFSELKSGKKIDSFRRNLQRVYVQRLIAIMLNERPSPFVRPAPEDARSLARYHLAELDKQMEKALDGSADVTTKAHLMETRARIEQAMDAELMKAFK